MKRLKLYEEFNNAPLYKAGVLANNIIKDIKLWFAKGSLSKQNLNLQKIEGSFANDVSDKNIKVDFDDGNFQYQVIISISINELFAKDAAAQPQPQTQPQVEEKEKNIENIFLQIKKYDFDESNEADNLKGSLADFWEGKIKVSEFTEDFIIEKISEMEDKQLSKTNTAMNVENSQPETEKGIV